MFSLACRVVSTQLPKIYKLQTNGFQIHWAPTSLSTPNLAQEPRGHNKLFSFLQILVYRPGFKIKDNIEEEELIFNWPGP